MNFNKKLAVAVSGAVLLMAGQFAFADSTTDIVDALVGKGVLTEEEGKLISKGHESKKKAEGTVGFKDGFKFTSGDGKSNFSINGRVQLDYRNYNMGNYGTANDKISDTFDVRRAYLGAKGTFRKYYDWEVTADFASLSGSDSTDSTANASKTMSHLDVAYFNVNYFDKKAMLQFGQFKMPMSLEERTSSRFIDFQERSFVNNTQLTSGKERGIMLWGTPITGVNYALAMSSGQGKNNNEYNQARDSVDYIAHIDTNIAEIMGNKEAIAHFGLSYSNTDMPAGTTNNTAIKQRTEARGYEFFAPTTLSTAVERTRTAFETALAYQSFKLQGEYANANFKNDSLNQDLDAYYVSALWLVTGENYADSFKGGKFDRITPKKDFNPDFSSFGAIELGLRLSQFDGSELLPTTTATSANKVDTITAGLKWIPTGNARIMLTYVNTDFNKDITLAGSGKTTSKENAFMMRAQYDF